MIRRGDFYFMSSRINNKYRNKKIIKENLVFDSAKEYRRYCELKMLEKAGEITDLKMQVKYILIPAQREPEQVGKRGGKIKGKLIEKECAYYADFVYVDHDGSVVVEDTKGMRTKDYILKRKMMLYFHGVRIREL